MGNSAQGKGVRPEPASDGAASPATSGSEPSGACARCGDDDFSPNIEAFEISGELLCDECAEEVFEDNGQFGVGA